MISTMTVRVRIDVLNHINRNCALFIKVLIQRSKKLTASDDEPKNRPRTEIRSNSTELEGHQQFDFFARVAEGLFSSLHWTLTYGFYPL